MSTLSDVDDILRSQGHSPLNLLPDVNCMHGANPPNCSALLEITLNFDR